MAHVEIPVWRLGKFRLFELFPVILSIAIVWIYAVIVTQGKLLGFEDGLQRICSSKGYLVPLLV